MKYIVSIVSHGHEEVIINLGLVKTLSQIDNVVVICRDNLKSNLLEMHCKHHNAFYVRNSVKKGFSENNNLNYIFYYKRFKFNSDDMFLLINPDIMLTKKSFKSFIKNIKLNKDSISTANLFLDSDFAVADQNVRLYPKLSDFVSSYFFNRSSTIVDKEELNRINQPIWSSGAFMAMSSENYLKLNGLDESFYLYCEDVDLCRRALKHGIHVNVAIDSKIVHMRSRDSKRLFSRYFWWHVHSALKYLTSQHNDQPKKSSIYFLKKQQKTFLEAERLPT